MRRAACMAWAVGRVARTFAAVSWLAAWLLWFGVSPALAQQSFAPDRSDAYGTAGEPGWSLQLMQFGSTSNATLLVFDAAGQPVYFTATLAQPEANAAWSGDLLRTTGPYFGAVPYNAAAVSAGRVGTMTFTPTSADTATLQYSINGVAVTKSVSRQQAPVDNYSGAYTATVYVVTTHCSNTDDNGSRVGLYTVTVDQKGTAFSLAASFAKHGTSSCTYSGTYVQTGRTGAVGTSYTCSDGDEGNISFFQMTRRPGMFAGWLQGHSITDSCDYSGSMTGLMPL